MCVCVRERDPECEREKLWSASLSTSVLLGGMVQAQAYERKRRKTTCCDYVVIFQRFFQMTPAFVWIGLLSAAVVGAQPIFAVSSSSRFSRIWCVARCVAAQHHVSHSQQGSDLLRDTVLPQHEAIWTLNVGPCMSLCSGSATPGTTEHIHDGRWAESGLILALDARLILCLAENLSKLNFLIYNIM